MSIFVIDMMIYAYIPYMGTYSIFGYSFVILVFVLDFNLITNIFD